MAKVVFGEYAAFTSRGGVRFSKNGKMVSEGGVPPEAVAYLKNKLQSEPDDAAVPEPPKPEQKFPMPTEEEKARMREESLKVKPELQMTATELAAQEAAQITADDFDAPDSNGDEPLSQVMDEIQKHVAKPAEFHEGYVAGAEAMVSSVNPNFLESVSIHTAPLEAIAQALYDRFGVYTIWLNMLPQSDEVNPLTGEPFTKYHQGIAYQAAIAAHSRGVQDPSTFRRNLDEGRAASENFQKPFVEPPKTLGDARRADSFAYRTSVQATQHQQQATRVEHITGEDGVVRAVQVPVPVQEHGGVANSRYDAEEDEQVLEPPIHGTNPIIKPDW